MGAFSVQVRHLGLWRGKKSDPTDKVPLSLSWTWHRAAWYKFINLRQWPTWCTLDFFYFTIHYYISVHVSSTMCLSSGGWIVLMQHLVLSSQSVAVQCTGWESICHTGLQTACACASCLQTCMTYTLSTCAPDGHWLRVTIPDAAPVQFKTPDDEHIMLETCRGL